MAYGLLFKSSTGFFFNDTATTEIYTLSLHDALPIFFYQVFDKGVMEDGEGRQIDFKNTILVLTTNAGTDTLMRSEEHTSELQSQSNLVCRLLLEEKNPFLINLHTV